MILQLLFRHLLQKKPDVATPPEDWLAEPDVAELVPKMPVPEAGAAPNIPGNTVDKPAAEVEPLADSVPEEPDVEPKAVPNTPVPADGAPNVKVPAPPEPAQLVIVLGNVLSPVVVPVEIV